MYKFKEQDIISSTVVANPRYKFTFFNSVAYINDQADNGVYETGSIRVNALNLPDTSGHKLITNLPVAYNFKNSSDPSTYPVTASAVQSFALQRDFIRVRYPDNNIDTRYTTVFGSPATSSIAKFISLKNSINFSRERSSVFNFDSYFTETLSLAGEAGSISGDLLQDINMISLDNIFYGSMIKPGSVNLEFYQSGSLLANCKDTKKNGELIEQTNAVIGTGTVVGFALYEEGIIVLTNTGSLTNTGNVEFYLQPTDGASNAITDLPRWTYFGSYIDVEAGGSRAITGSAYVAEIQGTTVKPTITMFAHAPKNELNWSNNPTFISGSDKTKYINNTSSLYYEESSKVQIKNVVSSSFEEHSASFKQTTFIRTVGVYDEDKNLIAVAKVANPVKKTVEQDYTFKLKLDL